MTWGKRTLDGRRGACAERRSRRVPLLAVVVLASLLAAGVLAVSRGLEAVVVAPGTYKTLTRIRLREFPSVDSAPTGDRLEKGEVFEADAAVPPISAPGVSYLRVAGRGGWVFDQGIAGAWVGKDILERLEDTVAATPPQPATTQVTGATSPPQPAATAQVTGATAPPPPAAAAQVTGATAPPPPSMPTAPKMPTAATVESAPAVQDPAPAAAEAPAPSEPLEPVVAIGMAQVETVRLPENMLGAGFELLRLEVQGAKQPLAFVIGTAFPRNALTPRGRELLPMEASQYKGGWLSQAQKAASTVDLEGVRLFGSGAAIDDIKGCEVLDFPQAQLLGQLGIEVHGILGQPFFEQYDMDLDRYGQRAQFYSPGQAAAEGFYSTVRHLPGLSLPSGNLGVVLTGSAVDQDFEERKVSFVGLVDSAAAHTVINWEAAKLLGYSGPNDPKLMAATKVLGAGKTGQAEEMPVVMAKFSVCGVPDIVKPMLLSVSEEDFKSGDSKGWYFDEKTLGGGPGCLEMGSINVAIGDVLGLSVLTDSMIGPFTGAAAIVGQDLLFQAQRVVVNLRDKNLWLEPGDIRDAPEM